MSLSYSFLLSDVDGTLVTRDHTVTARARTAIDAFRRAGGKFTIASSRPPRGMEALARSLALDLPFAAINGGLILAPDFSVLEEITLPAEITRQVLGELRARGFAPWLYRGREWWVEDEGGERVEREAANVGFRPDVGGPLEDLAEGALKLTAVSLDPEKVKRAEAELSARWAGIVQVSRSHAAYLDVTPLSAHKGHALKRLAELAGADLARTAAIGDMTNDLAMFEVAAFSIAMGNAPDAVKARAKLVTDSNAEEGFAKALEGLLRA